jgi:hypothetical protein
MFNSLRDYLAAAHGKAEADAVFEGEPRYLLSESYPDESLHRLVGVAATRTGREPDEVLFEFGVFTAESTFARFYPGFFASSSSARGFLLTVEARIHELVRATIPAAEPPRLAIEPLEESGVSISYESPRRLCVLLRGMTEGAARHYGEHADVEETTCMLRGDPACSLEIRFSDGLLPA